MRNTAELRDEILAAARAEFAQYGLAGARIDRIAKEANASKERLYAHFGDKESLFNQVVLADAGEMFGAIELLPDDVAGFVGQIFDMVRERPDHIRMVDWARLERVRLNLPDGDSVHFVEKMRGALREAQARGLVDERWDPADLLTMLFGLGLSWVQSPDPSADTTNKKVIARRRADAVEAARRIIAPAD
ncbi:TetR family transcriptional regulator [Mycobacteroides immunogenum]|uniref:TetR family transcriptional regulator n=1 Tax=Mycobacteroides immunogenum TaxID=83262 RepID=A0A7V8RYJ6_9MYCO|nr:TetR family transcriptional regulator [Mycobacteroides immunogenum]AMT73319.1 TetR family transcriptional regulator [Mycobacteroides immunogenum]ANO06480.1 TetR family transcriptional regulator [Mycobacteroides immunogenum]KIU39720.1 TetR family transcriptional regulator [Mycobacteroides immunogenum]KPG10713.1 TetR family transcriptional regulator [Mycobacteroides immunogenum]KPG12850.1 TetR family transcriptional regulator [Mycobacteroides immunogenum]